MFILINKLNSNNDHDGNFYARVESVHHTVENAEKANDKLQKAVKKWNGQNCYMPTVIAETRRKITTGEKVYVEMEKTDFSFYKYVVK